MTMDANDDHDRASEPPAGEPPTTDDSADADADDDDDRDRDRDDDDRDDDDRDDDDRGPVDQLGIPMSREPTLDDVRGDGDAHRRMAFGCTAVVTLFVIAFWLVRGYLL